MTERERTVVGIAVTIACCAGTFSSAVARHLGPAPVAQSGGEATGSADSARNRTNDGVATVFGAPPTGVDTTTTHFDATTASGGFGMSVCGCSAFTTLNVSGLSGSIWDVDTRVHIAGGDHDDLTVRIQSPAGTVVYLSSLGYCNYSNQLFDDSAAVLATDIAYGPSSRVPEGALGQLIGEDPNGTWSVSAEDNLCTFSMGVPCFNITAFSVDVTTIDAALTSASVQASNATPASVPSPGSIFSDITISGAGSSLCDVNVTTFIDHARSADLNVSITSPAGTTVSLVTRIGFSNLQSLSSARVLNGTVWDDQADPPYDATNYPYVANQTATPLIGEGNLSKFIGEDPNGVWRLTVNDAVATVAGTLTSWALDVETCALAEPGVVYCTGDGLDTVLTAECPCGNVGDPGRGCANSNSALGGARMWATGTTVPNTIVFRCDGMPNNSLATFWRGSMNNAGGMVFHDGIQCVAGAIIRFGQQVAGQDGNEPHSIAAPAVALAPGTTRYYQTHYRNPNAGFCPPGLFNMSNGYIVTW